MKQFLVVFYLLISSTLFGVFLGYMDMIDERFRWLYFMGLMILYLTIPAIQYGRKTIVTLSDEDRQTPINDHIEFCNRPMLKEFVLRCILFTCTMILFVGSKTITEMMMKGLTFSDSLQKFAMIQATIFSYPLFLIVLIALVIVAGIGHQRIAKNKYIIDGNTLIIKEHPSFSSPTELTIPIAIIEKVYFRGIGYAKNPVLYITIGGNHKRLNLTNHSLDLAKAILIRQKSAR